MDFAKMGGLLPAVVQEHRFSEPDKLSSGHAIDSASTGRVLGKAALIQELTASRSPTAAALACPCRISVPNLRSESPCRANVSGYGSPWRARASAMACFAAS